MEHDFCPEYPDLMRGHTYLEAIFIETFSDDPYQTSMSILMQSDLKGNVPPNISNNYKRWIDNLSRGIEYVKFKK